MDHETFRCPEELVERAERLAKVLTRIEGEEVTPSEVYRRSIKLYLEYRERDEALTFVIDD